MFRCDWPYFVAFDALMINGEDLTGLPLVERKRRLRSIMPRVESRILYLDQVPQQGVRLFEETCRRDCEGKLIKCKSHHTRRRVPWGIRLPDISISERTDRECYRSGHHAGVVLAA